MKTGRLQDLASKYLDERGRSQMQTKRFPSGPKGWKGVGVQGVSKSFEKRAPTVFFARFIFFPQ